MSAVVYLNSPVARKTSSKTLSALTSGHILQGARWSYRILGAVKGDNTHTSDVYKAEVVPRESVRDVPKAPQWFIVLYQPYLDSEANSAT
jgi:hypothetical protein